MALDHLIRLSVRFHVASYRREIDLAIPAGSSLAEVIDEIAQLCEAPRISRPWRPCTAAGQPLDPTCPLEELGLAQGAIIVLEPEQSRSAPVIRDAAEALVAGLSIQVLPQAALIQLSSSAGLLSFGILLSKWVPGWAAASGVFLAGLILVLWFRELFAAGALMVLAAGTAGWWWITLADATASLAAAACTAALSFFTILVLTVLRVRHFRTGVLAASTAITWGIAAGLAAAIFQPNAAAFGAGCVLAGLIGLLLAPMLSSGCAGLKIPPLPSAGQDLSRSDLPNEGVERRADRAHRCHDGLTLGCCLVLGAGLIPLSCSGELATSALILATGGSLGLHGLRHASALARWAQALVAAGALIATTMGVISLQWGTIPALVLAAVLVLLALSCPWWVPYLTPLTPPQVAWVERIEALCLAAAFPLAVQVMGIFALIRSLG